MAPCRSQAYGFKVGAPNVIVDGFTFTNQAASTSAAGVFVDGTHRAGRASAVVRNVTVTGSAGNGVRVTSADGVTVTHVTVSGSARVGVLLQGATNSTVSSSTTFQNQREGVSIQGGSNDVAENVTTHDNVNLDGTGTRLAPGINVTNWVPSAGAAAVPASNITVQRNVSYNNDDSGIQVYGASRNVTVRRNLTYDNGDHGIDISQASTATVVSNTVVHNWTAGINIESTGPIAPNPNVGSNGYVRDNVSVDNGYGDRTGSDIRVDLPSTTTGSSIDNDLVFDATGATVFQWGTYFGDLAGLRTAAGQEMHGMQADPKLDASYVPGSGSPAIDAADTSVTGWSSSDLNGNAPADDPTVTDTGAGTPSYADLGAIEQTTVPKPSNQPPTAALTATPSTITAGGTVTLDASGSTDADGTIASLRLRLRRHRRHADRNRQQGRPAPTRPRAATPPRSPRPTTRARPASATAAVTVNPASTGGGGGGGGGGGTVNASPTAKLTTSPSSPTAGGAVSLDASGSTDSDGTIASYAFDCGATGVTPTGTGSKATCTYPTAGSYTATVTVTDNQGATGTATAAVTVGESTNAPTAALVGGRTRQGEPIRIDARGSHANGGATIVSYTFRCAGHVVGPKAGARAVCTFRHRGIHRVWVKVTDSNGMTGRAMARVRVRRGVPPVAQLSLSTNAVPAGNRVIAFAGSSTGSRWSYVKDVRFVCGNGQRSHWRESMTYRCRFDQPGRYTVTVVVRNTLGLRDRTSQVVRVRRG